MSNTRSPTVSCVILSMTRPQTTVKRMMKQRLPPGRCYSEPTRTVDQATTSCRSWVLIEHGSGRRRIPMTNTNACARRFSKVLLPISDRWATPQLRSMASDRTCGSPTTWLCTALGSSSLRHFGVKSCTAYTLSIKAKTAPDAALDKSSTGQDSRRTFRT